MGLPLHTIAFVWDVCSAVIITCVIAWAVTVASRFQVSDQMPGVSNFATDGHT